MPAALETSMANMQTQAVSGIIERSHGLDILTRAQHNMCTHTRCITFHLALFIMNVHVE